MSFFFSPLHFSLPLPQTPFSLPQNESPVSRNRIKRMKSAVARSETVTGLPESPPPVVLVDSQEAGIRLVHTLMACVEAIYQDNMKLATLWSNTSASSWRHRPAPWESRRLFRRNKIYPQDDLETSCWELLQADSYVGSRIARRRSARLSG